MKYKNLYLYLALACFLGIVLIFVFDGYLGVYDTITINTREFPQEIEPDYWLRGDTYWSAGIEWNGKADISYEVDNRRFFSYSSILEVSVWRENEKIANLITREISAGSFEKWQTGWVLDTSELLPSDASAEQGYQFTLLIKRGDIERRIIINVNSEPFPLKPR